MSIHRNLIARVLALKEQLLHVIVGSPGPENNQEHEMRRPCIPPPTTTLTSDISIPKQDGVPDADTVEAMWRASDAYCRRTARERAKTVRPLPRLRKRVSAK